MKKSIVIIFLTSLLAVSCYKEAPIKPTDVVDKLLFDFPQGSSEVDRRIQAIQEKYDTYLIYKDIPNSVLNRAWVNVYINSFIEAQPVPADLVGWYVDFVQEQLLDYFDAEKFKTYFPRYLFLVTNMHRVIDGQVKPHMPAKTDGVDFWALSFRTTESGALYLPEEKLARITLAYQLICNMLQGGLIEIPITFYDGIDYNTMIYDDVNNQDKLHSAYHYQTRGFVKYVQPSFEYESPLTNIKLAAATNEDFLMYVRKILYSTTAEFAAENGSYALVMRRYNTVLDVFNGLGIDLAAISDGK
ncbi:MAG: hypothetical protein MJY67_00680 [Bacteroidales bacterium]|nr:hypothetical protein [Bacteroidales bacterium]